MAAEDLSRLGQLPQGASVSLRYVYVVQAGTEIIATFTVKYEMVNFLKRLEFFDVVRVTRWKDGKPGYGFAELNARELLGWA